MKKLHSCFKNKNAKLLMVTQFRTLKHDCFIGNIISYSSSYSIFVAAANISKTY